MRTTRALASAVLALFLGALAIGAPRPARGDLPFGDGVVAPNPPYPAPLRVLVERDVARTAWLLLVLRRATARPVGPVLSTLRAVPP